MRILYLDRMGSKGGSRRSLEVMRECSIYEDDLSLAKHGWRPHERKSLFTLIQFLLKWRFHIPKGNDILYDVMHINHESLIWYAIFSPIPVVCHVRTMWPKGILSLLFRWLVLWVSDAIICISENEKRNNFRDHPKAKVIYNIAY